METYLILTEKPDAEKNFIKALGGNREGEYDGYRYRVTHSVGHVMQLKAPEEQVDDQDLAASIHNWGSIQSIPWPLGQFKWEKVVDQKKRGVLTSIQRAAKGIDAVVLATDNDESGEGDVIGMEIVKAIHWGGKVLRCYFPDESVNGLRKALKQSALKDVTDPEQNPAYRRGIARQRFDYGTQGETRIGTYYARHHNFDILVHPGRLKSVLQDQVYKQTKGRDQFKAQDQFQAVFEDEQGHRYVNPKVIKHLAKEEAQLDANKLHASAVDVEKPVIKQVKPPKMMFFSQLSLAVTKQGFSLQQFIDTYQKMYQDHYLSYPRSGDRAVDLEQWQQLVQDADKIASVVGIDLNLLVHKEARAPYVTKKHLAHGVNRPGTTIPKSMDQLAKAYGQCGALIYEVVARSALAVMGPDYQYEQQTAKVHDFPEFVSRQNQPKDPGYKQILLELDSSKDGKKSRDIKPFGQQAEPTLDVSQTKPPKKPNQAFLINFLIKHHVGTEATRVQTLTSMMNAEQDRNPTFKVDKSGTFHLTPAGWLTAAMMQNSLLSSPKATRQLTQAMNLVAEGKWNYQKIYDMLGAVIENDRRTMEQNLDHLPHDAYLKDKLPKKSANSQSKASGVYAPTGEKVRFSKIWRGTDITNDQVKALLSGDTITLEFKDKYKGHKQVRQVDGKLAQQEFEKKDTGEKIKFWGFNPDWQTAKTISGGAKWRTRRK